MDLKDQKTIRILINRGGRMGHQKAPVTLMKKLRQLGFNGTFDVIYRETHYLSFQHESRKKMRERMEKNWKNL